MIQDILPYVFKNQYATKLPNPDSYIMVFSGQTVLINSENEVIRFPRYKELAMRNVEFVYLFAIDENEYYLAESKEEICINGYTFEPTNLFRKACPRQSAFAGITAFHLYCWYRDNSFCGRCGKRMEYGQKERVLICKECNNAVYPKISPAIIVAVTDGDRLLMTKYAGRDYKKYALVAGFTEIGESAEQTVDREIMEEVGLKVKNITYYKSQPWAFTGCLLMGFFAELDGSASIVMDKEELAEATWISRDDIPADNEGISLTGEMINYFKKNGFLYYSDK